MFSAKWFFDLETQLKQAGLDSDAQSFDQIKENLRNLKTLSPDDFSDACAYVILASGFSQKTAKKKHAEIINYLKISGAESNQTDMLCLFNNQNKTAAILKIWKNRVAFCRDYYTCSDLNSKLTFLSSLPHIGKITANHLARNLGENVVKYDIWIQRLGALYANDSALYSRIDNGNLDPIIKDACDAMFANMEQETHLPRGYIDVVLWKACQNSLIEFK